MVKNTNIDNVYSSLSDPVRRHILLNISDHDLHLQKVAEHFKISLPAVSKHLKVLESAELITRQKAGREYNFGLTDAAKYWITQFKRLEIFLKKTK